MTDFLRRWKTGIRLAFGFAAVLMLFVLAGGLAVVRLIELDADVDRLLHLEDRAAAADEWRALTQLNVTRAIALARADGHPQLTEHLAPQVKATSAAISKIQERLEREIESPRAKEMLVKIHADRTAYLAEREKVLARLKAGENAEARRLLNDQMQPAADRYVASIEAISSHEQELVASTTQAMRTSAKQTRQAILVLVAVCVLLGATLAWLIARSIVRPLDEAVAAADAIGRGELDHGIRVAGRDEAGALLASLERMRESLRGIVVRVRQGADGVATASSQIAQGNQELSSRTEKQAAALEETASSMEELGSTVRHNADNARQANQLAQGASTVAAQGGEVVDQVVRSMREISEGSKKIADITGVIDSIAFQTNILALNAAVESARAGEQGRGFAVVASEVRSLAHRSAEAAREIKALIGSSVDRVEQGTVLAERAGQTMTEVVSSIRRVSDIMAEISAATSEQSSGITQVGQAVAQMDQTTQQNAALVEESAAAAESLKMQSQQLVQSVSIFRVAAGAADAPPAAPAAAPGPAPWNGEERRGPDRARNVVRPRFERKPASEPVATTTAPAAKPAATGTDDDWQSF